jgi:hypothetical protein
VNLAYKIQHLWFCTVESSVRVQDFGCAGVGCVFCVLAATWVWSGNYCFNRGRRYLRKMQRRLVSTKLTTSCQWKKMVSPILSIIFLVEVATLQSCSIHFLARSVATLIKKWAKVVDLLWSFCFWQEDFAYMFPWWWGLIGIFGLFWIGDRCHEKAYYIPKAHQGVHMTISCLRTGTWMSLISYIMRSVSRYKCFH